MTMMIKPKTVEEIFRKDRDYRFFQQFEIRAAGTEGSGESQELFVEGYACRFNEQTVLFEYDGIEYKEQVDDRAFDGANMSDVIFNYNHGGKVIARTRNQTLSLTTDKSGLYIRAKLDGTAEGRQLYEEIQGGYIDRMSYAYIAEESAYDSTNHIRTIRKIKRLFDVSAVDIPAYDTTNISARSFLSAEQEIKNAELLAKRRKRLSMQSKF
ncbi:HK97 family phage prohead protease [Paenibacillus sp. SORGH_AS338]|uniref:HK97 family phage prohead protease n=1 Tax=Paenibacillus sp. SORGH_AS_0338 TaxID=3041755 RepID=UPI00285B6E19|nr:HK97 family phage prohead protease [Paenibacillus sp. SORGH_AS_0338]MDR6110383.1 HK97 family phage prohead protease [Paenibacillus sp. SORGH_AS_0338]